MLSDQVIGPVSISKTWVQESPVQNLEETIAANHGLVVKIGQSHVAWLNGKWIKALGKTQIMVVFHMASGAHVLVVPQHVASDPLLAVDKTPSRRAAWDTSQAEGVAVHLRKCVRRDEPPFPPKSLG